MMRHSNDFVHLNVHSDYSLQRSIATISEMVAYVAGIGQKAIALTDSGNLFGAVEFSQECKKHGVRPIIGCKLWICKHHTEKIEKHHNYSLILLCKDKQGFFNLKKLSSIGYIDGFYYVPRVDMNLISQHSEGLACIIPQYGSEVSECYTLGQEHKVEHKITELKNIFGDDLYVELQNHGESGEQVLNKQLDSVAKKLDITIVAGNDCHYVKKKDAVAHGVFLKNGNSNRDFYNEEYYIKTHEEMSSFFLDYPHALEATTEIAEKCAFQIEFSGPQLPEFAIPKEFTDEIAYLRHLVFEGLKYRYNTITEAIQTRAEYELSVITSMGYSGYFLIVWDIIAFAHASHIPVGLGRGSAAGSIVAYALGITGLDPLKYGLLFERFLNPERVSMPDIDTDFCVDRRQDIIHYIRNKYGDDHVGQIITFSSLKPKGAIRDVARSLDISYDAADEIAKLIPYTCKTLDEAKDIEPKLNTYDSADNRELFEITDKILGVHRHASLHAAGIVIGKRPLLEYVPLYKDSKSGAIATQYTMDYLEDCGLVKMDILGLRTVTIIENTEKEIQKHNPRFSIETIPENDEETFAMLSQGESDAVFQFESPGMKRALRQVKPTQITDLIALNALYRPGPMQHIETYAKVKQGEELPQYHLDVLEDVLKETYGVIVYQEQVMEIARVVAGYSLGKADILRRVMGKKKEEEMKQQLDLFVQGAIKNKYERHVAEEIFKLLAPFAGYGFNKSHAAAYGVLAYRTAYLKCHYPQIFFVCQLDAIASNSDSVTKYVTMCKDIGIKILPPDVNYSEYGFSIEGDAIRYGLNAVKTISDETKKHIPQERKENGKYTSVVNVIERMSDNRGLARFLEAAIASGMFDSIDERRALLFANKEFFIEEGKQRQSANKEKRILLFTEDETKKSNTNEYPNKQEDKNVLLREREYLGVYITQHPIKEKEKLWKENTTINLSFLDWEETTTNKYKYKNTPKNHYLVCYVDSVSMYIKKENTKKDGNIKIYSGIAEDLHGSIPFMYRVLQNPKEQKNTTTVEIPSRSVCTLVGQLGKREDGYIFWVSAVILDENEVRKTRISDTRAAAVVSIKTASVLHIEIHSKTQREQLSELYELFKKNLGRSRTVFHIRDEHNTTTHTPPPGLTVNTDSVEFMQALQKFSCVKKIWCE